MARLVLCTIVIALKILSATSEDIIASCPNLMRVGNIETVFVSLHDRNEPVDVTVKLTLFENGDDGLINETSTSIGPKGGLAYLHVNPERIPSVETEEVRQEYAFVTVHCPQLNFRETKQVFLSYEEGYVFIQTDKPIYTPNQSVKIRVISLNQTLNPSSKEIRVDIVNPRDVIVHRRSFDEVRNGIIEFSFKFDQEPMFGHWKIVASYGKDLILNRSVQFEVKEYVLPTFSVKIEPPKYILQRDTEIPITVTARYVYGKLVRGRCFLKVGVQAEGEEPEILFNVGRVLNGEEIIVVDVDELGENWFEVNLDSSLYIEATVVEDATGHFENASDSSAKLVESPYMFTWERTIRYFKKGLPYEVKTDLKFVNGKFAPDIPVRVTATASIDGEPDRLLRGADRVQRGQNGNQQNVPDEQEPMQLNTNEKGQVNFRLYVPGQCTNIHVVVETVVPELVEDDEVNNNARLEVNIHPFESPAENEFLVLRSGGGSVRPARDNFLVDVFLDSVTQRPILHYFVISRGKIMQFGKKNVANVDGLEIPISYEMVPSARIVGYYISDSGHIISDSLWVEIERECENRLHVSARTFPNKDFLEENESILPQSQIFLRVTGTPGTSVALLAVDQAVLLLRDYHRLTPDKMYGTMDEHDTGCGPGGGRNPANVFMNAGLVVISTNNNLDVPHREGPICVVENSRRRRRSLQFLTGIVSAQEIESAERFACGRGEKHIRGLTCEARAETFPEIARTRLPRLINNYGNLSRSQRRQLMLKLKEIFIECCNASGSGQTVGRSQGIDLTDPKYISTKFSDVQVRNDFRESWAFDVIKIPEDRAGPAEQIYSVPGSITTWSIQAFGLHNEKAMCIPEEVKLKVFQELFIQLDLPYSVVRKERVEIQATVFNYRSQTLAGRMFLMVPEEVCSEGIPGEFSAEKGFEVEGYGAVTITYMLVGLKTGEYPIKVAALTTGMSDIVEKKLKVLHEGVVKTTQHSTILNPTGARIEASRLSQLEGAQLLECGGEPMGRRNDGTQSNCLEITLPQSAVPESASCYVSISGNAMGPVLTSVISGLESWILLPSGCGEQTMIRMAPTVYVLRYLTNTESGTDADRNKALDSIEKGYRHELQFNRDDGSFAVWSRYPGSTWLTAFVAKVFCQASEYTLIESKVTCGAIKWLTEQQNEVGAFTEAHKVYHREMTGGVQGDAALTAFVLIAMHECDCGADVPQLETFSHRATAFLEQELSSLQRPYVIAIVTYALALVESGRRYDANNMLKRIASYDAEKDTRHWGTDASSLSANLRPYWYQRRPSAISVETTGYALLAQIFLGEIAYSHSIVKWLSQQQNYGGGFVSTQDTVVALQALSEYATLNSGGDLNMYCNITAPGNFKKVLRLQEGDALVQKTERIPPKSINGKLMVKTGGDGIGQLNVEVRYNDIKENDEGRCPFNLEVNNQRLDGPDGTPFHKEDRVRIRICATYLSDQRTGMAIIDVGLYSGFTPVSESLKNLVGGGSPIDRTELSGRSVIFYMDHIPSQEEPPLCFQFDAKCEIVVGNLHHASVHVYDYYNPGEECREFYAPPGENVLQPLCNNEEMCTCVSSKCAACSGPDGETTEDLLRIACATADTYVYKIEVTNIDNQGGFKIITGMVEQVIKRGEDQEASVNFPSQFWVSSSCDCPGFRRGRKYMVIGRNTLTYEEQRGELRYKYIIDNTATVRLWKKGRNYAYLRQVHDRIESGQSNCG